MSACESTDFSTEVVVTVVILFNELGIVVLSALILVESSVFRINLCTARAKNGRTIRELLLLSVEVIVVVVVMGVGGSLTETSLPVSSSPY